MDSQQPLASLIVTTEPGLFVPRFAAHINRTVFIYDNSADVFSALASVRCGKVIADYRQLADRWSGQKLLQHIRRRPECDSVAVWLMSEQWHPSQEEWAVKCGAVGMLRRDPDVLAEQILDVQQSLSGDLESQLDRIDAVFGNFAGPMRSLHIEAAREAIVSGRIDRTRVAYVEDLASKFTLPDRRAAFLEALRRGG